MKGLRSRLTYANVMATVAVFIALGGASYAATQIPKNSVGSKQIKKEAVTAAKIKKGTVTGAKIGVDTVKGSNIDLSSLESVPSAIRAETAGRAQSAGRADSADVAKSVAPPESVRLVGTPGQPPFENLWSNSNGGQLQVRFYKDRGGFVHLEGSALGEEKGEQVFTLPIEFRPEATLSFSVPGHNTVTVVRVLAGGEVRSDDKLQVDLSGIIFRPAGQIEPAS